MQDTLDLGVEFLEATNTELVDLVAALAQALDVYDPEPEHQAGNDRPLFYNRPGGAGLKALHPAALREHHPAVRPVYEQLTKLTDAQARILAEVLAYLHQLQAGA